MNKKQYIHYENGIVTRFEDETIPEPTPETSPDTQAPPKEKKAKVKKPLNLKKYHKPKLFKWVGFILLALVTMIIVRNLLEEFVPFSSGVVEAPKDAAVVEKDEAKKDKTLEVYLDMTQQIDAITAQEFEYVARHKDQMLNRESFLTKAKATLTKKKQVQASLQQNVKQFQDAGLYEAVNARMENAVFFSQGLVETLDWAHKKNVQRVVDSYTAEEVALKQKEIDALLAYLDKAHIPYTQNKTTNQIMFQ